MKLTEIEMFWTSDAIRALVADEKSPVEGEKRCRTT